MLSSLFTLTSVVVLAAIAPLLAQAAVTGGTLYATRLHGSPTFNHTVTLDNAGNLALGSGPGYNFYEANGKGGRGTLVITGPYCLGARIPKGNSYIQEQDCSEGVTVDQLFTPNYKDDYTVLSLRGDGTSANPSRPYLRLSKDGSTVYLTSESSGDNNIHLVLY